MTARWSPAPDSVAEERQRAAEERTRRVIDECRDAIAWSRARAAARQAELEAESVRPAMQTDPAAAQLELVLGESELEKEIDE